MIRVLKIKYFYMIYIFEVLAFEQLLLATNKPFTFKMYSCGVWYVPNGKKQERIKKLKDLDLPLVKLTKLMTIA